MIKNYGTGGILRISAMPPDEKIAKMPLREEVKTEAIEQKSRFKTA